MLWHKKWIATNGKAAGLAVRALANDEVLFAGHSSATFARLTAPPNGQYMFLL